MSRDTIRGSARARIACAALSALALSSGCASSNYAPQVVARGELTLRYDGGFELSAAGKPVARGLRYSGLENYVRCVPEARDQAQRASSSGKTAIAMSVLGGVFGAGGLIGLGAIADGDHWAPWLASGLGLATVGLTFSILSWRYKNHANGHAIDAMNFYNDSVGSLGATCDDLVYPPPAAAVPPTPPAMGAPTEAPPQPGDLPPSPSGNVQPPSS